VLDTPITDRGLAWADSIIAKRIPACRKAIAAAKRFKRDLKRAGTDAFPYVWEPTYAEHLCAFVEECPHIEGEWANRGELLELSGWQAFALGQINGWRHRETGLRRFRYAYIEVPRKNGKSTLLAAVGLYFLAVDGEKGAKVFSAASSTDQARIVFDAARAMAGASRPDGRTISELIGLLVEEHKIKWKDPETNRVDPSVIYRPVAAQTKSQDGKNPHCAIVDELHEHLDRRVWDAMTSALGAREQPLLIAITTAGHNTAGVCYEQRRYLSRILDEVSPDESYFGMIFEADEGDEPGDPATWEKANPNLGVSKSRQYLKDEWSKAQASPAAMGEFLRKHLDIWTSIGAAALDMPKWRAAEDQAMRIGDFAGRRGLIGVDLATVRDFASVVAVLPDDDIYRVFSWHFLPDALVQKPGNEHFYGWARDGWIRTTPGPMLDLKLVEALVLDLAGQPVPTFTFHDTAPLDIEAITADPTYAAQMAMAWESAGLPVTLMQSRAKNMHVPFQLLVGLVEAGRLVTDGNPVLAWMAGNTLMKQVQGGDMTYPAKLSPEDKIDGITALINALWPLGGVEEEDAGPSVYEQRGVLVI
jgi:phage terminase large subunit-like protein